MARGGYVCAKLLHRQPDQALGALQIIIIVGCLLNFVTLGIDLSGTTVAHFWFGLFVPGVGWNFMFIGGTALLTETYRPSEKTRSGFQRHAGVRTMAVSSSSARRAANARGWEIVNHTAAPFIAIALIAALCWPSDRGEAMPALREATLHGSANWCTFSPPYVIICLR